MTQLTFQNVSKAYGDIEALVGLNLEIASGEFFALVGSSGCGKSTAMRVAAGLETPDYGTVRVDGRDITGAPPRDRGFGLVTQQNALVGSRSAEANISLPLKARQVHRDDISKRVTAEAQRLGITYLLDRRRHELSGGETQAVQLARALVARPKVLLLDEPLARIDSSLRLKLRNDMLRIQREYGLTTLLITSEQEDAMVLADRVAVLDRGRLQQIGPPIDLYRHPVNLAVASFFGEPAMNLFLVDVVPDDGLRQVAAGDHRIAVDHIPARCFVGSTAVIGVRPEDVVLGESSGRGTVIPGIADRIESRGSRTIVHLRTEVLLSADGRPGGELVVSTSGPGPRIGDPVDALIEPTLLHLFDSFTGAALHHPG